jgi:hypothetical protein
LALAKSPHWFTGFSVLSGDLLVFCAYLSADVAGHEKAGVYIIGGGWPPPNAAGISGIFCMN